MSTWFINLDNFNIQEAAYKWCLYHLHGTYKPLSDDLGHSLEKLLSANALYPNGTVIHGNILVTVPFVTHLISLLSFRTLIWLTFSRSFPRMSEWRYLDPDPCAKKGWGHSSCWSSKILSQTYQQMVCREVMLLGLFCTNPIFISLA